MYNYDGRHLDGKKADQLQLSAEDLDLVLDVPINAKTLKTSDHAKVYRAQCEFLDAMMKDEESQKKIAVLDHSESGLTLLTRFNPLLEEHLATFMSAINILAFNGEDYASYDLTFTDPDAGHWQRDVRLVQEYRHYVLLTDAEMYEKYGDDIDGSMYPEFETSGINYEEEEVDF